MKNMPDGAAPLRTLCLLSLIGPPPGDIGNSQLPPESDPPPESNYDDDDSDH